MDIVERFLKYVSFETTSDEFSDVVPTSPKEFELARYIAKELEEIGLCDVVVDEHSYVYAYVPASEGCENLDTIGLMAHMDTSPDAPGANIKTRQFVYEGGDIVLNDNLSISCTEYDLDFFKGQELIVTDGTTLLGADDKAGAAEIVTAMEYIMKHPELKHGKICVAFTPDEEVGGSTKFVNLERFDAKYAYTLDGGRITDLEYECFNGASARVVINGLNIHPGSAKNKMRNAVLIASEYISLMPPCETPEHTEGYEGFYHVNEISGDVTQAVIRMILRDHDYTKLQEKETNLMRIASYLNEKYGPNTAVVEVREGYRNMREKIEPVMYIVERAEKAFKELGVDIKASPIRGGTDGAALSYMGVPCPNLPTGGENYHSVKEFVSVDAMKTVAQAVVKIVCE